MLSCPSCATDVPPGSRFCLACGGRVSSSATGAATLAIAAPASSPQPSGSVEEGRFPAGAVLAGRYRVLGLLGRGGMGEVYRANDLKLGQSVALKFLPAATATNASMLARLHAEVRIARQVSHPNVCRVYDIGDVDGAPYLTMEYVDGEDLGSLIRRIGRLPGDKAVEIARRICAGVAAAHDKGVLHRDLKPANVMIDGRGQVLLTDFGLAGLAGQVEGGEIRNGTPAYMAPEQLAGREVTVRSDIYALGLLFYEMFTGRRAFQDARRTTPPSVTNLVKDIDPAVERVIFRCLAEDPRDRPLSALAVAAALPGGDPLAAALAAGETPSPEMVAAAGESETISVRSAVASLALVVGGLISLAVAYPYTSILERTPFEYPPEALAQKSRDLIHAFGYPEKPADSAYQFALDDQFRRHSLTNQTKQVYAAQLAAAQPALLSFNYRQSPRPLETVGASGVPSPVDPAPTVAGMISLRLDGLGRLLFFQAMTPQLDVPPAQPAGPFDWRALFTAGGLDPARFQPTEPRWLPLAAFDARAAWTGSYPVTPEVPVRVEAAAWRGKPVYFQVILPWTRATRSQPFVQTGLQKAVNWLSICLVCLLFLTATGLAWRNTRLGRGDTRGAFRVAVWIFTGSLLAWICTAKHVASAGEFNKLVSAISEALFSAVAYWIVYVALEPYARRSWPRSLVAWTRLLSGRIRDPLAAGHILFGIVLGIGIQTVTAISSIWLSTAFVNLSALRGVRSAMGDVAALPFELTVSLYVFLFYFLLRAALRRTWLAAAVFVLVGAAVGSQQPEPLLWCLVFAAVWSAELLAMLRWGLLPVAVGLMVSDLLSFPLTINFSAWYAGYGIIPLALILGLAVWAFHTALAGRRVFREGFLDG
jgi:hypothetical protein